MNLSWTHVHLLLNHFPIVGADDLQHRHGPQEPPPEAGQLQDLLSDRILVIPVYDSGTQAYATMATVRGDACP